MTTIPVVPIEVQVKFDLMNTSMTKEQAAQRIGMWPHGWPLPCVGETMFLKGRPEWWRVLDVRWHPEAVVPYIVIFLGVPA